MASELASVGLTGLNLSPRWFPRRRSRAENRIPCRPSARGPRDPEVLVEYLADYPVEVGAGLIHEIGPIRENHHGLCLPGLAGPVEEQLHNLVIGKAREAILDEPLPEPLALSEVLMAVATPCVRALSQLEHKG